MSLLAFAGFACSKESTVPPAPSGGTVGSGVVTTGSGGASSGTGSGGADGSGGAIEGTICPPGDAWDVGATLYEASSPSGEMIVSVTPDELSLAWVEPAAGGAIIHYGDRGDLSMPFGFPQDLSGATIDPLQGIALSQDGLRLVTVQAKGTGFVEYLRAYRGEKFDKPTTAPYASINAQSGFTFADPVLSGNDGVFLYSRITTAAGPTVFESRRSDVLTAWPAGDGLTGALLTMTDGKRRRPTGISSDLLSLFYRDDVSGLLRVVSRATPTGQFTTASTINAGFTGQPNSSCTRLYYTGPESGKTRIWVTAQKP